MTPSRTILALAAATLGVGLAWSPLAQAQSGSPTSSTSPGASSAPMAPAPSASPASSSANAQSVKPRSDAQVEARIKQLHGELKITSAQEDDWNKMAQDMRDNAQDMATLLQQRNTEAKSHPMNAVDNLKNYEQITDAHADGLKKIVPDFETLYDSMSSAQKKTADTVFNRSVNQRVRTTARPSSSAGHG
jgi:molecular chaperone GrpE (heat shock protein)